MYYKFYLLLLVYYILVLRHNSDLSTCQANYWLMMLKNKSTCLPCHAFNYNSPLIQEWYPLVIDGSLIGSRPLTTAIRIEMCIDRYSANFDCIYFSLSSVLVAKSCYCNGSSLINSRCMCDGYASRSVCVCVCVCVCVPHLYVESQVSLGLLCYFLHMHCVDFDENALFKSSGDIC